ncbi:MAG: hypothetical protein FD123_3065 [Bacteroidetes bacterium]|nr:MAG: hypothetical protein FD123_3065 [Bacteroidota bacterium]
MNAQRFLCCLFTAFLFACLVPARAQQSQIFLDPDAEYHRGLDLFEKEKFSAAQEAFRNVAAVRDINNLVRIDAEYYNAVCAMELFNKDAEILLKKFLEDHPESPRAHRVYFHLGKYNYRKKDYRESLDWFAKVDMRDLEKDELPEFFFKRGYCYFETGKLDSAKHDFYEIKDVDTKYTPPANYYFSHICYIEGNYETALLGFQRLVGNEAFGPVVPYYIAQIYYLQGKYDEVIVYAPALLDSAKAKRAAEIARIIGESYYRTGRYEQAIPYFEKYRAGSVGMRRSDLYEIGYSYYKTGKYNEAIPYLQDAIAGVSDTLSQSAWYHLGDCYVRIDNKSAARNAFGKASEMKFDKGLREDALFSYARLSYELSYSPFNEAIVALQQYINEYPNSARKDEAYSFLVNVYLSTKNYRDALKSIEQIKVISPALQPAYQQVCYNRAVELFNSKDHSGAIAHLDKALKYPVNRKLTAYAHYWKAEALYAQADANKFEKAGYNKAIDSYKAFQNTPGAPNLPEFNTANYNIGYALFQQADYEGSATWFRKFIAGKTNEKPERIADAYMRMADAYFMKKPNPDHLNAAEFYGEAVAMNLPAGRDYAMYQQAMALGYLGKKDQKAELLKRMLTEYPKTTYVHSARYQQARTYHDLKQFDKALEAYQQLYNDQPKGPFALKCLMQMGLIYHTNVMNMTSALDAYTKALELASGEEKQTALQQCKEIYLAQGDIDGWEAMKTKYGFSESNFAQDSSAFVAMVNVYKEGNGNCSEVIAQAGKYIQRFPNGYYTTEVHYMKAECQFKNDDVTNALASYNVIIGKPSGKFTESALQRAGYIYYKQKEWPAAAAVLAKLEKITESASVRQDAQVNLMRCYFYQDKIDSAVAYASKAIMIDKLPADVYVQAHFIKGKSAFGKQNYDAASTEFTSVMKANMKNEMEAEAKYDLIYIGHWKKGYKTAEKELFKYVSDYGGYPYWKGRGFLLLADNYLALKDTFQAKYILKNYADNGEVPELKQEAQDKLAALEAITAKRSQAVKPEDTFIPLDGSQENDLYDNSPTPKEKPKEQPEEPKKEGGGR